MDQPVEYWVRLVEAGKVVVYGPVVGTAGSWGLGVLVADDESQARSLVESDPAISSGLATFEFGSMPVAVLPD
jgi:uncharacterized protein